MDGMTLHPLRRIAVEKGDIYHALKCTDAGFHGFGEAYFSEIGHGLTKGWKRHNRMTLNIVVAKGAIRFFVHNSETGETESVLLGPDICHSRLELAPGLWMAFRGEAPGYSMLLDIIPDLHDPSEADKAELDSFPLS